MIDKLLACFVILFIGDIDPAGCYSDLCHFRDYAAHAKSVSFNCQVIKPEQLVRLDAVRINEATLKQLLGNLESDEIVVLLRNVASLGDLHDIKAELGFQVGIMVVFVGDDRTIFGAQLGIDGSHPCIDCRVAPGVGSVMAECPQGKGKLVDIARFPQHDRDEISRAHIMEIIGEFVAAERIVANVLNNRATVGVGMSCLEFVFCGCWESFQEGRLDVGVPGNVNEFFVGENTVGE